MKRHSIRTQLTLLIVGIVACALILVVLTNVFFLGSFYEHDKINTIVHAYSEIDRSEYPVYSEEFEEEIDALSASSNLQIMVTDTAFETICTTSRSTMEMQAMLFGYYTGLYSDEVEVLRTNEKYIVQKTSDKSGMQYLEIWGELSDGNFFLMRTPMESIREAARISNRFFIIIGAGAILVALIAIFLISRRFTEPIIRLTEISRSMKDLDFQARYEVRNDIGKNEIDVLGEHFNAMSDELEETISELKSANVKLRQDVENKTRIDERRKEFLNSVSHELKTPIALISGYAEGLKEGIADDPESREYYLDVIMDESAKMNRLVQQLLTLNHLESGTDELSMSRFDLTEIIQGVLNGMDLMLKKAGARVLFDDSAPVYVWGDAFKIEEVVTNYISNAIHHLDYEKTIDIRMETSNGIVKTTVFNSGDPIPKEEIGKIWEKFYKVDKARTRAYGGSGIGLSIVKAIMDAHGGTCGVTNYGNGVAFYFTLEGKK